MDDTAHYPYSLNPYFLIPSFIICDGINSFLFQDFFQKFRSVSHAKRAFAKHLSCTHTFEQFALCGTVALLCLFLFPYYYLLVVLICCFDFEYKDNAFIIDT